MGCFCWSPESFWNSTIWDFAAALSGFKKRNGIKSTSNPRAKFSREEAQDLLKFAREERAKDIARDKALKEAGANGGK